MFELALAHINQADREREIEAALRRRQLLDGRDETQPTSGPDTVKTAAPAPTAARLRTAGR